MIQTLCMLRIPDTSVVVPFFFFFFFFVTLPYKYFIHKFRQQKSHGWSLKPDTSKAINKTSFKKKKLGKFTAYGSTESNPRTTSADFPFQLFKKSNSTIRWLIRMWRKGKHIKRMNIEMRTNRSCPGQTRRWWWHHNLRSWHALIHCWARRSQECCSCSDLPLPIVSKVKLGLRIRRRRCQVIRFCWYAKRETRGKWSVLLS